MDIKWILWHIMTLNGYYPDKGLFHVLSGCFFIQHQHVIHELPHWHWKSHGPFFDIPHVLYLTFHRFHRIRKWCLLQRGFVIGIDGFHNNCWACHGTTGREARHSSMVPHGPPGCPTVPSVITRINIFEINVKDQRNDWTSVDCPSAHSFWAQNFWSHHSFRINSIQ